MWSSPLEVVMRASWITVPPLDGLNVTLPSSAVPLRRHASVTTTTAGDALSRRPSRFLDGA
jgi:hypothetical protein